MKSDLRTIIVGSVRAVVGRLVSFAAAVFSGACAGIVLGRARIAGLDAAFGLVPPLVSSALVFLSMIILLLVYLRFETSHWLLAPAFVAFLFEGYWVGFFIRSIG